VAYRRHPNLGPPLPAVAEHQGGRAGQGSVEEGLVKGHVFRVHWAGGPPSNGGGNCGNVVDLDLGQSAMQALINAEAASKGASIGF